MKVLKVSVILPYYEARYVIGQKIEIRSNSGNTLDVITASINLLYTLKITKEDFYKHIEKLERYKETKYKK